MQADSRKAAGDVGEDLAAGHLIGLGFKIVARNVSYKVGEIDIVARRGRELHFVEVKARKGQAQVSPLEAVTEQKKRRLRRTAEWYLSDSRNGFKDKKLPPCFFSVVGIDFTGVRPRIECVLDAFS